MMIQIAANSMDVGALLERGLAFLGQGEATQALADFERAAQICQQASHLEENQHRQILYTVNLYLSRAALAAGELQSALDAADQALELQPDSVDALLQRSQVWVAGQNWDEAQNDLEQAFGLAEQDSRIACLYAVVKYRMGDKESAFATLEEANDANAWLLRGELHLAEGDASQAKKAFLKAVKQDKTLAQAYPYLGYFALQEGKLSGAEEILLAGLRYGPQNAELRLQLAHVYLAQARWQDALGEVDEYLALKPQGAAGLAAKAEAHRQMGQAEEALEASDRAVELAPSHAPILFQHALLSLQANDPKRALLALDAALQAQPGHTEAHRLRAELLASGGFDLYWRVWQSETYAHLVQAWQVWAQIAPDFPVQILPLSDSLLAVMDAEGEVAIWVNEYYQIRVGKHETSAPLDAKMLLETLKEVKELLG